MTVNTSELTAPSNEGHDYTYLMLRVQFSYFDHSLDQRFPAIAHWVKLCDSLPKFKYLYA